jgi:DIL domain
MQIRMNVSVLEDWARSNNRQPEHYENGSSTMTGESVVDAARRHLNPVIQLLQWLQCFTSLGEDHESLVGTLTQLQRLSPTQLIHAVKNYRPEVGEKGLPKVHMKFLVQLQKGQETLIRRPLTPVRVDLTPSASGAATPVPNTLETTSAPKQNGTDTPTYIQTPTSATSALSPNQTPTPSAPSITQPSESDSYPLGNKNQITIDPSLMLPFSLPTSTDMLITYGAGIGGTNRERARKYIPTVPTEVLSKLNLDSGDEQSFGRKASSGTVGTTAQGWRNGSVI